MAKEIKLCQWPTDFDVVIPQSDIELYKSAAEQSGLKFRELGGPGTAYVYPGCEPAAVADDQVAIRVSGFGLLFEGTSEKFLSPIVNAHSQA